jgi:hypothetical protein
MCSMLLFVGCVVLSEVLLGLPYNGAIDMWSLGQSILREPSSYDRVLFLRAHSVISVLVFLDRLHSC